MNKPISRNTLLYTTHPSVKVYCKEEYSGSCTLLSEYFQADEIKSLIKYSDLRVDNLLTECDKLIASTINNSNNLNISYFKPMYSYYGKHQYLGYICFVESLQRIQKEHNFDNIIIYNGRLDNFYGSCQTIGEFVEKNKDTLKVMITYRSSKEPSGILPISLIYRWQRILRRPVKYLQKGRGLFFKSTDRRPWDDTKSTILIAHSMYNLEFLRDDLIGKYNLIELHQNEELVIGDEVEAAGQDSINMELPEVVDLGVTGIDRSFIKEIIEDFRSRIPNYLSMLKRIHAINSQDAIVLGIWGNPPINGFKALTFEYLMKNGVKVIGAQHGSVHGVQKKEWQMDSDFTRCHHFISYGFTQSDLEKLYDDKEINVIVNPMGRVSEIKGEGKKKEIDILFPITNSMNMFNGGMARTLSHILAERQEKILYFLDTLTDCKVHVKPFVNMNPDNLCVLPILKRLKNVKVCSDLLFEEYLGKVNPRIIIIEFPSTPLFEALSSEAQLFVMNDEINPYGPEAFECLNRRVYYYDDVENLISDVNKFLKGELQPKKDSSFYNQYVYKQNSRDRIAELVDQLAFSKC